GEPKAGPFAGDLFDHRLAHADRPAPGAARLRREFVGRVETDLAAETRFRGGEVEIIDWRMLHQRRIAHRVHAGRDRPHYVLPVAHRDVVIHDDDELRVHK